jgi:hypothetical protein
MSEPCQIHDTSGGIGGVMVILLTAVLTAAAAVAGVACTAPANRLTRQVWGRLVEWME